MSSLEKIAGRRAELDQLAESLAKQFAERVELAVAERVLRRLYEEETEAAGQDAGQNPSSRQRQEAAERSLRSIARQP